MIRTLIVEDEPLARRRLLRLLGTRDDVEICGTASDGAQAVALIERLRPDLLLLDIQMPELSGFEVLRAIGDAAPFVIFTTAYDEYAVRAFEVHALDYLLKPFGAERLHEAIERAIAIITRGAARPDPRPFLRQRLMVRAAGRIAFVNVAEIEWIEAADNYVCLHIGSKTHLMRGTLRTLVAELGSRFMRIHKSAAVNLDAIVAMRSRSHGDYELALASGASVAASRTFAAELRAALSVSPRV